MERSFEQVVSSYAVDVQTLAAEARRQVMKMLPGAMEIIDPTAAVVSYGYGAGYRDMVCTLILSKSGVKLGLVGGAALPDPEGLLEGSGKKHKYVVLRSAEDLNRRAVQQLVKDALKASRQSKA